ncbi:MAG: acetyl-CoA carboxylase, biotin carboxyl carrier protein, partial [Kiritimatiellia bacterium]|nr:acetyl-CoA carboxylase, biotin carboxyl carrier protein [Kiritimatiellia bacterium]
MDLKDIRKILEMMKENDLSEFEMEDEGFRIAAKRGPGDLVSSGVPQILQTVTPAAAPLPAPAAPAAQAPSVEDGWVDIVSPMVGTFYRASSPDAPPYAA